MKTEDPEADPIKLIAELNSLAAKAGLENTRLIIDGGFFRGSFSKAITSQLPSVNCIGFEPNQALCQSWNSDIPQSGHNIKLENLALGRDDASAPYYVSNSFPATNSLLPRPTASRSQSPYYPKKAHLSQSHRVRVTSLDKYCKRESISNVFLLKLDLQGGELDALEGARHLISRGEIAIIYSEAVFIRKYERQPLLLDLWSHLTAHNYRLHSLHDIKIGSYDSELNTFRKHQYNQCDALFVSSNLVDLLES